MELNKIYFYTASILNWSHLLELDKYKDVIIDSLKYLVDHRKLKVYGFVIIPNHIHLIWEMLELNGKEMPHASFMKYTSHVIQKYLKENHQNILELFKVQKIEGKYQFWQREALPVWLYTPEVIYQKLDYIHNNPCQGKWMLADSPILYRYSSASFYEMGNKEFPFLSHIGDRL